MNEEINIDTGRMIYNHILIVNPPRDISPGVPYEDAVEELKTTMAKSKARLDKPYKITLRVEEL